MFGQEKETVPRVIHPYLTILQALVSVLGTFRDLCLSILLDPCVSPRNHSHPSLSLCNLQNSVSVYGTFRPPVSVFVIFRPLSQCTEPSDPCLSQLKYKIPVLTYGTFRPLSQSTKPSDPFLSLRNLQTPVSVYGAFRPLSQSMEP